MPDRAIRTVLDGMSCLECARWHGGRMVVSDFSTRRVVAVDLDGGGEPETVVSVAEQPAGLGWMPGGSMLVVAETLAGRLTAFDAGADGALSAACGRS